MNKLFIVSAPSGSGKTSIMREVMGQENEVVSFTTREKRDGEIEGKDYIYISKDKFNEYMKSDNIIESTSYPPNSENCNYYGITADELYGKLDKNHSFIIVDYDGMKQLKMIYPNIVTIYIHCDKEDAIKNMIGRGDKRSNIDSRVKTFEAEQKHKVHYDFVVKNDYGRIKDAIEIIKTIVKTKTN